jgi:hypothetical protein
MEPKWRRTRAGIMDSNRPSDVKPDKSEDLMCVCYLYGTVYPCGGWYSRIFIGGRYPPPSPTNSEIDDIDL